MGWNERSDPDMRTANFCDVYREGVYRKYTFYYVHKHFRYSPAGGATVLY